MMTATDTTHWLTTSQAARQLGVTPAWVRTLMKQDRIQYASTPLGRLVNPDSLADIRAKHDTGSSA